MTKKSAMKKIPIQNKGSKEIRFSEPVIVHVGQGTEHLEINKETLHPITDPTTTKVVSHEINSENSNLTSTNEQDIEQDKFQQDQPLSVIEVTAENKSSPLDEEVGKETKQKTPTLTMEQFILQAYARKGQRIGRLTAKQEKALSASHKLEQQSLVRLINEASQDRLLQVPRQLLLIARDVDSHPYVKKTLMEFVHTVMIQHPIFAIQIAQDALNVERLMPQLYSLYKSISTYQPSFKISSDQIEGSDLQKLRANALNLMTVWLFNVRRVSLEDLMTVLLQCIWKPAADKLNTESSQIKALTEVEEPEALGWIAQRYLKIVVDAQSAEQRSHKEAVDLRSEVMLLRDNLNQEITKSNNLQQQLDSLQQAKDKAVEGLQQTNQVTRMHLSHDIEIMRGRLIENLQLSIERLETGLSAINRELPLIEVIRERVEIVIENLQSELKELDKKV
jgi:hypothetical protein